MIAEKEKKTTWIKWILVFGGFLMVVGYCDYASKKIKEREKLEQVYIENLPEEEKIEHHVGEVLKGKVSTGKRKLEDIVPINPFS